MTCCRGGAQQTLWATYPTLDGACLISANMNKLINGLNP